jgi:hypothetical protein
VRGPKKAGSFSDFVILFVYKCLHCPTAIIILGLEEVGPQISFSVGPRCLSRFYLTNAVVETQEELVCT